MKKIAYIELDTHAEIAQNFMELMQDSKVFSVDFYLSEKIFKLIDNKSSNIILTNHSLLLNQLKKQNYDLVIIGTVHRYFNLFKTISDEFNTSIIVHNMNFCSISKVQLFLNIFKKDFIYRLKLLLLEGLLSAPMIYKNAKNLLVLDENLTQKMFRFLPVFYNKFNGKNDSQELIVVIPGTVSQQRRDYNKVIESLFDQKVNREIKIVILGKAVGKEFFLLTDAAEKLCENITLQYFPDKVSQLDFDKWMRKADILWCPIRSETEFFSQKELYGVTKMSGNIGDAIKYGKIAIFPENYPSSHPFIIPEIDIEDQIYRYHKYIEYNFQEKFSIEKVRQNISKLLISCMK